ncbi:serine/threonine-protein kinase [Streptomyces sp. NPDC048603]|uniref:serine/threonine-protein kinase n=1 Tax=Streptomyces sp. NPDC048603 TaxID=3365577 RepID=UPI003721F61E
MTGRDDLINTTGSGPRPEPLDPQDPREVAGYRLLARIGEGGMGSVYLSRTRGGQPVALKVIRREYAQDEEFRRRFEQEARAARQVQGYHIVPVVDHDTAGPRPWLATAYVPGLSLDAALAGYGPLPEAAALQLTGCAAEALQAVHKAGVIHRDLKPSNVLIGSDGPWVIDFGIARAADATHLTRSGGFIGTPQYMSPEHAGGLPLTPASDVFSLGLIAAVCATGRHPYGDGGAITVANRIANTATRPPDLTGYPEPLRTVLTHCLAADPRDRPGPAELAALCEQFSGRSLRDFGSWLPAPLASDIAGRELAARRLPDPPGAGPAAYGTTVPPGHTHGAPDGAPQPAGNPYPTGGGYGTGGGSDAGATHPRQPAGPPVGPPGTGPLPPSAAPARRRGRTVVIGAVAVAVVAVAVAGWALTRKDGPDTDAGGNTGGQPGAAARPPSSSGPSAAGSTTPSPPAASPPQAPASGGAAAPSAGASGRTYKVLFENRPFAMRFPTTGYSHGDLDAPKMVPSGSDFSATELIYSGAGDDRQFRLLKFETPTGLSDGTTPEQCERAAGGNALSQQLDADAIERYLTPGALLCTVTKDENLAMMKITKVEDNGGKPDFLTELTLWDRP